MHLRPFWSFSLVVWLALVAPVAAQQEDVGPGAPPTFKEGDVISMDKIESLKPFLPPEFWANRDFFFYEGMKLEVGPFFRDYSPAPEYHAASAQFKGQARVGPGSSLENYTAGQPFPMEEIDCLGDPRAGDKIIWNFDQQWEGDGTATRYFYSYWDRGEELPLYYVGTSKTLKLSHRIEKEYLELPVEVLETGCCGMAGAFGMLRDKAELSRRVAEPMVELIERTGCEIVEMEHTREISRCCGFGAIKQRA